MKSGAKDRFQPRMLSAALKNKQIDKRAPLVDSEVLDSVRSLIKQRKDSIEQFAKGGRQDLVTRNSEVSVSRCIFPAAWPREVEKLVREAIAQTSAQGAKTWQGHEGACSLIAGRADNKLVSELVKSSLGKET